MLYKEEGAWLHFPSLTRSSPTRGGISETFIQTFVYNLREAGICQGEANVPLYTIPNETLLIRSKDGWS